MPKRLSFNITHKILLLVAMLSALAALTTVYSLNNMHNVDKNYRVLLEHKTQNTLIIGEALVDLSDAGSIAFSVLTEQEEQQMRVSQNRLFDLQFNFIDKLNKIGELSTLQKTALNDIHAQQAQVFGHINDVIEHAARWRGDLALITIHTQLEPKLYALRTHMDKLRQTFVEDHFNASQELADTTQSTIFNTAFAIASILTLALSVTSLLAYTNVARPITRLTHVMRRLSDHQYDVPIGYQQRSDEIGLMAKALHVFRDTMRRADRLEIEVARSEENQRLSAQLVALTDAMPGAVFQLRLEQNGTKEFLFLSSKAEQFLAQPIDSLLNRAISRQEPIFPGSSAFQRIINKAFARSQRTLEPIDTDIRVESGQSLRWYKILASCKQLNAHSTLFNGILLDVTASKEQAQALEEAKNSAEQATRAQTNFLNTMSHEIRTPMNAILGLTQLALKHEHKDEQLQRLNRINAANQHLLTIINDVLDFSKIDGNHLELEHIAFNPTELIANTVEMLTDEAHEKGLQLQTLLDPQLPSCLHGDPTRIGQILMNYLNNAIKFSSSGLIRIHAQLKQDPERGPLLYCEVQDQGMGISEQNIQHLFKEFKQADASISRRFGGTGLGLAISSKLAQLMGGQVGVRSQKGQGSTFWFSVGVSLKAQTQTPITPPQNSQPTKPMTAPSLFQGQRILLVDDNELNRIVAQAMLEEAGFTVDLALDGAQAIAYVEQQPQGYYSAVLMDIMMPVLDGIRATEHIRTLRQGRNLPIIALSANTHPDYTQDYTEAGLDAYLSKPICEQKLRQTLVQHITLAAHREAEMPSSTEPHFEQQALQSMHTRMGDARFMAFLTKLLQDYQARLDSIAQLDCQQDTTDVLQNLHDLISTAGHAGFQSLSQHAAALHQALITENEPQVLRLQTLTTDMLQQTITYLQQQLTALSSIR